ARRTLFEICKDLCRAAEAEIVQQHDDLLLIGAAALRVMDDEGRRHERLFLKSLMRMHPVRAAGGQREVVVGRRTGGDRWRGDIRDAVLLPWRGEAVPMNQGRLPDLVLQSHAKGR